MFQKKDSHMPKSFFIVAALLITTLTTADLAAAQPLHHTLDVSIDPGSNALQVEDVLVFPAPVAGFEFLLHPGLRIDTVTEGVRWERLSGSGSGREPVRYRITAENTDTRFQLRYRGVINEPLREIGDDYAGAREASAGLITPEGVFLDGSSFWYPVVDGYPLTFSLRTHLPKGWHSISQGQPSTIADADGWQEGFPQDEIYLIAGRYYLYSAPGPIAEARVYLREPDAALAGRYLQASERYLDLYSNLLGPYPYDKFALVENFWESGYGMPSFTLLGPRVIRLPFILHSSYPHEILHNWWGNSVYVDYGSGNWSEGLTSYLADHLLQEQQGLGSAYRRDALQRYSDYVAEAKDFPLTHFRGRHGQASQAIGYGKAMMFFHMLRRQLGDTTFREGLRRFYRDNRFKVAGYHDLQQAFENVADRDLSEIFLQWTGRTGAPALQITDVSIQREQDRYRLRAVLHQNQKEQPFRIRLPILFQLQGEDRPRVMHLDMTEREQALEMGFGHPPLWLAVDPLFDIFRRLDPSEIPSSVGRLFGAQELTLVLPSRAPSEFKTAYANLAREWTSNRAGIQVVWDNELEEIPSGRMVWLFGRENTLADNFIATVTETPAGIEKEKIRIENQDYSLQEHSVVLTGRNPDTVGWISLHAADLMPLLARKLPHYGKYSYLVFQGPQLDNVRKGQWALTNSSLIISFPGAGETAPQLPEHEALK